MQPRCHEYNIVSALCDADLWVILFDQKTS